MPIFMFGPGNLVEVGPSTDGKKTYLGVRSEGVWIPPEWARKVAKALNEYADREERGELHHVAGGRTE
jgi:hypothetical protein